MSSTFDQIANIIAETCDIPRDTIKPESHAIDDLGLSGGDALLRYVRKRLRQRHAFPGGSQTAMGVRCVYSPEDPVYPWADGAVCATCGERRVSRTVAPAPRFRGVCVGPSATREDLGPLALSVAPSGGLPLKD